METKIKQELKTHISNIILLGLLASAFFALSGCNKVDFDHSAPAGGAVAVVAPPICYPFGVGVSGHGLVGNITYLSGSQVQNPFNDVMSYINNANGHVPNQILLGDLNVPTRYFSSGFSDSTGSGIKASDGTPLVQYFGIHAISYFVLGNSPPGDYQLALLSDDGAILSIKNATPSGGDFVINNDGTHSTKMGCTSDVVHMTATSKYQLTVDYYQGPPNSIALFLIARPVPSGNTQDPQCGRGGQDTGGDDTYFFNDTGYPNPPVAQQPAIDLYSRGWAPVDSSHFSIQGLTTICQ